MTDSSSSSSIKTQTVKIQATFDDTVLCLDDTQTKDLKCATKLLSEKFKNMSEEKKVIVRELGFDGLMHISPMRVHHKLLKELANSFNLDKNTLEISYGSFRVKPSTIGVALGLNASGDLFLEKIFKQFQGKTLKYLTDQMMRISVENEQDRLIFKRIFILYIQMAFLLPTTINKISPVHLAPIFKMDKITEGNWGALFIIKSITNFRLKKKKSIDGCIFALMIIYFQLTKNKDKKGEKNRGLPWISNWNREQLGIVKKAETKNKLEQMKEKEKKEKKKKKTKKTKASSSSSESDTSETEVYSSSEFETEEDSEKPKGNNPPKRPKIIEDSSPEQTQSYEGKKGAPLSSTEGHYDSSEIIPKVNLGSENDPLSQGQTDQSSINKPADGM
ncbi:hypothetical protein Ahy_A07g033556 [Arachis hypogaea]|uniref:Aminotransferase-like plant mobile domain-containing protein n=1 Tax=Arachis hypogaea TaxID=3818 RepID=A0A445C9J5_ARAHY|nr:hypothetical protein Ahy_A07g033556 [Arachis hypogaea]